MEAFSLHRTVGLGIRDIGAGRPGGNQLLWSSARIAAKTNWWNLVVGYQLEPEVLAPRLEAMAFKLEYFGVRICEEVLR